MISFCKKSTTVRLKKLDDVLAYFNKKTVNYHIHSYEYETELKEQFPNKKELKLILEKLILDKYISREYESDPNLKIDTKFSCRITYQGSLFSESGGYQSENKSIIRKTISTRAKTIANMLNAISILAIGAFGVYVSYDSKRKEETINTKEKEIKTLNIKVDSLTTIIQKTKKVTSDNTPNR